MLLQCRELRKTYRTPRGAIAAVDGIDLEVRAGEFLAVCGRSGSGKSTLLAMLGGLCRPSAGTVQVDGVDLGSLGPSALAEFRARRFGFLFQFTGLLPNLRAIDNVALPSLLGGTSYALAYRRARELMEQVGVGERWDAYPGELSGGQQRRVALARALVNQPLVLFADEPTNDLDEQSEREVLALLREMPRAHNTTLIVVSHDPQLASQAERVIYLRSGKVVSVAQPTQAAVEPAMVRRDRVASTSPASSAMWEGEAPAEQSASGSAGASPSQPEPTQLGAGLGRFVSGFAGWALLIVCGLWAVDYVTARVQRRALVDKQVERKKSEQLALQQLRAGLEKVAYRADGGYEIEVYLQNVAATKPLFVLGPSLRVFVQVDRNWQEIAASPTGHTGHADNLVHEVTGKQIVRLTFRADPPRFDELLRGYMHLRVSNVMIVSASAEPAEDVFQRSDDYYVYLKPQKVSEAEVRKRNGWSERALVPRWMGMPSH